MKKTFIKPFIGIDEFERDIITTSGVENYPGYQRVIDSLNTASLDAEAEIVNWFAE